MDRPEHRHTDRGADRQLLRDTDIVKNKETCIEVQ